MDYWKEFSQGNCCSILIYCEGKYRLDWLHFHKFLVHERKANDTTLRNLFAKYNFLLWYLAKKIPLSNIVSSKSSTTLFIDL